MSRKQTQKIEQAKMFDSKKFHCVEKAKRFFIVGGKFRVALGF